MTTFDDRERAFESKFAHDQEIEFRAAARRNRLLGRWAGEQLGKSGEELDEYAKTVVHADFAEAGDDDVLRKVEADLEGKHTREEIRAKMDALMIEAREQIQQTS